MWGPELHFRWDLRLPPPPLQARRNKQQHSVNGGGREQTVRQIRDTALELVHGVVFRAAICVQGKQKIRGSLEV